jgi:hypothetical protein
MAKVNWSFLWEAFALASGIPPSTLYTVPGDQVLMAQPDVIQFHRGSGQQAGVSPCKLVNEERLPAIPICQPDGFENFFDEFGSGSMTRLNGVLIKEGMAKNDRTPAACHCMTISQQGNHDE